MTGHQTALTTALKAVDDRASPESVRSLLGNQSSAGSTSGAEYFDDKNKKDELNLYDWLSASNSPRQKSRCSDQNIATSTVRQSDFDQMKICTPFRKFCLSYLIS